VWRRVPAVSQNRVHLAPGVPFGVIDSPPAVNRLAGLPWLLHVLYPEEAQGDLRSKLRAFYSVFYQVNLDDTALDRLLDAK
jgi:iron complex transport system substrate-binding protein